MGFRWSLTAACAAAVLALAGSASAQTAAANPYTTAIKTQADLIRGIILRTADKIPEDLYAFKATPEVRSVAGILGHIADGNILICTFAKGEKPSFDPVHEKKTTRADLVAALKESFAFCDQVFAATTDANGSTEVEMFGRKTPKLAALAFNNNHMMEHYGNLVTYMRLNKIVPPSSERSQ